MKRELNLINVLEHMNRSTVVRVISELHYNETFMAPVETALSILPVRILNSEVVQLGPSGDDNSINVILNTSFCEKED